MLRGGEAQLARSGDGDESAGLRCLLLVGMVAIGCGDDDGSNMQVDGGPRAGASGASGSAGSGTGGSLVARPPCSRFLAAPPCARFHSLR